MKHKHHIIPKHMDGTDNPENLIELTIEEHAEAHRILYERHGRWQDNIAWRALSGQIGKEEILKELLSNAGKEGVKKMKKLKLGIFTENKELKKYWASLQPIEAKIRGGKTSGNQNAESGHCQSIAHLGGKASVGMKFWYNPVTNEETRSFESPGNDWIPGVKIERVNIEQLRKQSSNRKDSFWIHNPDTGESKMIFNYDDIPDGFIEGRKFKIKNTIDLLNVGEDSELDLKKIKSEFSYIKFDNWYKRWVFTFKIDGKNNKITHIDYWTLVWSRDCIINYYNLSLNKSNINFVDKYSKDEVVEILKSFREYLKIEKILEGKLKKSKIDIYRKRLLLHKDNYDMLIRKRSKFL
jgi:arginine deiminase